MRRLDGKIALITGGASGLGKAIAERFGAEGARVVIGDIQTEPGADMAARLGGTFLELDVTSESSWTSAIDGTLAKHNGLHILVNNAGILGSMRRADPATSSLEDWRLNFSDSVEGIFLGCRSSMQAIHDSGGGSIINICSIAGLVATPYSTAYGASKAAVRHLTKSVAQHCAERHLRVRCNAIHPGDVVTPLWLGRAREQAANRGLTEDAIIEEAKAMYPHGELIRPEDIASAATFLGSDEARQITGSMLVVDGGFVERDTFGLPIGSNLTPPASPTR